MCESSRSIAVYITERIQSTIINRLKGCGRVPGRLNTTHLAVISSQIPVSDLSVHFRTTVLCPYNLSRVRDKVILAGFREGLVIKMSGNEKDHFSLCGLFPFKIRIHNFNF